MPYAKYDREKASVAEQAIVDELLHLSRLQARQPDALQLFTAQQQQHLTPHIYDLVNECSDVGKIENCARASQLQTQRARLAIIIMSIRAACKARAAGQDIPETAGAWDIDGVFKPDPDC